MSDPKYLLDTSALLTFCDNEAGTETVEKILRNNTILLPSLVLFEVFYISMKSKNKEVAEQRYALLKSIPAQLLSELSEPVVLQGGEFKADFKLSLADSLIAAYAYVNNAILVHKDPEYEVLTMVQQMYLPYKKRKATRTKPEEADVNLDSQE
ncbi:PIN domain-containing protein [candidate division CSSED10-310 bacterium]|uniref:PIN domain-containing protein n=1 Tax=candidate division CSSED10-310 bacterium TaxID=2855610 RepID=A0ABV6YTG8_UNCC1